jgi:aminoglycoside N3'-acetyltransferase
VQRTQLVTQLHDLGVGPGDVVMVHSSYRAIRPVEGGPAGLLEALLEAVGPEGSIMSYVSWDRSPYDAEVPRKLSPEERGAWPAFDPATASAFPEWGILLEVLCRHPCAVRSANPDNSFAAVGAQAEFLMSGHSLDYGMGEASPLAKLCQVAGKVALLGAPLDALTLVHHADYLAELPDKRIVRYEVPVLEHGKKVWRSVEEFDSNGIVDEASGRPINYVAMVGRAYAATGRPARGTVGNANSILFDASDLLGFAIGELERLFAKPRR